MGFNFDGFKALRNSFSQISDEYEAWLRQFLLDEANRFMALVKPLTPVDTGDLRRHWAIGNMYWDGNALVVEILNPMEYATFVEDGHRQTPGRYVPQIGKRLKADWVEGKHMMRISLDRIYEEMPTRFNAELGRWMKRMGVT